MKRNIVKNNNTVTHSGIFQKTKKIFDVSKKKAVLKGEVLTFLNKTPFLFMAQHTEMFLEGMLGTE
jgi:hypothetical protein